MVQNNACLKLGLQLCEIQSAVFSDWRGGMALVSQGKYGFHFNCSKFHERSIPYSLRHKIAGNCATKSNYVNVPLPKQVSWSIIQYSAKEILN